MISSCLENRIPPFIFVLVLAIILNLVIRPALADQPPGKNQRDSVSVGTPMKGCLEQGEVLPKKGTGYILTEESRKRKARFGASELVALIKQAAFKVNRKHKGSLLKVADLSTRLGGRVDHHGSHQNGRDVDFIFYLTDANDNPIPSHGFVPVDSNGFSTDPPMEYKFDTKRNWTLVQALLTSDKAKVQWIFVSDKVKKLLLDYAREKKVSPRIIRMADQVLKQPGKRKAHVDHFHVRIFCPATDKPKCQDVGPRWAWIE